MVRMERFYQTSELGGNPLSVVFTIIDRLEVCKRLRQSPPFPVEFFRTALDDPLVTYLYLTCFDRLGQPAIGWTSVPGWNRQGTKQSAMRYSSRRNRKGQRINSFCPWRIQCIVRSPFLIFPFFAWHPGGFPSRIAELD